MCVYNLFPILSKLRLFQVNSLFRITLPDTFWPDFEKKKKKRSYFRSVKKKKQKIKPLKFWFL